MPIRLACSRGHAMVVPERLSGRAIVCPKCGEVLTVPGEPIAPVLEAKVSAASADAIFASPDPIAKTPPPPPAPVVNRTRPPKKPDRVEKREVPAVEERVDQPKVATTVPVDLPIEPVPPPLPTDEISGATALLASVATGSSDTADVAPNEPAKEMTESPKAAPPPPQVLVVTTDATPVKVEPRVPPSPPAPVSTSESVVAPKAIEPPPGFPEVTIRLPPLTPPSSPVELPATRSPSLGLAAGAVAIEFPLEDRFDPITYVDSGDRGSEAKSYGHRTVAGALLLAGLILLAPTIGPLSQTSEIDILLLPRWVQGLGLLALLDVACALFTLVPLRFFRITAASYLTLASGFWAALAGIVWLERGEHPLLDVLELNDSPVRRAALFLSIVSAIIHGAIACYCGMLGEEE